MRKIIVLSILLNAGVVFADPFACIGCDPGGSYAATQKEQADYNDKVQARLDQNMRDIQAQDANASANDALAQNQAIYNRAYGTAPAAPPAANSYGAYPNDPYQARGGR